MSQMMSRFIVGNWKMYKTTREAVQYIEELAPLVQGASAHLFLAVPYTSIGSAAQCAKQTNLQIGAQNMHDAREGAFTGEISSLMLKDAGASFVLLGHSERRRLFHESEAMIQKKVARALQDDLRPILCVGEALEERERVKEVLERQLLSALEGVPLEEAAKIFLAYEPVWAIGTGQAATPEIAGEAHSYLRSLLTRLLGKKIGNHIPILYGGSVTPDSSHRLMQQADIDGLLVGGASLDPKTFAAIVQRIEKTK